MTKNEVVDAVEIMGRKLGEWVLCLHCQRPYKIGEYRYDKNFPDLQMCPYEGCDGDTVFDAWKWSGEGEPVRGMVYDLY